MFFLASQALYVKLTKETSKKVVVDATFKKGRRILLLSLNELMSCES